MLCLLANSRARLLFVGLIPLDVFNFHRHGRIKLRGDHPRLYRERRGPERCSAAHRRRWRFDGWDTRSGRGLQARRRLRDPRAGSRYLRCDEQGDPGGHR